MSLSHRYARALFDGDFAWFKGRRMRVALLSRLFSETVALDGRRREEDRQAGRAASRPEPGHAQRQGLKLTPAGTDRGGMNNYPPMPSEHQAGAPWNLGNDDDEVPLTEAQRRKAAREDIAAEVDLRLDDEKRVPAVADILRRHGLPADRAACDDMLNDLDGQSFDRWNERRHQ